VLGRRDGGWRDVHREVHSRRFGRRDDPDLGPVEAERRRQGAGQRQSQTSSVEPELEPELEPYLQRKRKCDDDDDQSVHAEDCQRSQHFSCKHRLPNLPLLRASLYFTFSSLHLTVWEQITST
jgi:hypothetical protein